MAWRSVRLLATNLSAVSAAVFQCQSQRRRQPSHLEVVGATETRTVQTPQTLCPKLANTLMASISNSGSFFDCTFYASKQEFDDAWAWTWALLGAAPIWRSNRTYESRQKSTADSSNRLLDKARVESTWSLEEFGNPSCEFYDSSGDLIARGYEAIVYGDHGAYLEFNEDQIHWPSLCYHKLKGPERTHFEHYNKDETVKCYDQFQTVANQPNPPSDSPFSCANNRPDGYADYRPGRLYVSCDLFFSEGGKCLQSE